MKKYLLIILCIILVFTVGCSSQASFNNQSKKEVSKEEFEQLYSNPKDFKGMHIKLYAKIFTPVEKDNGATYIQAYADPDNSTKNTLITIYDPNLAVKEGDIIYVAGTVLGSISGTNAFGGQVTALKIEANVVKKSDYITAFSPAINTIYFDDASIDQNGFIVKVEKIEFAERETRVFITVTNNSKHNVNIYSYNSVILQNGKQYETETNYNADYPQVQNNIRPGVTTEGIFVFPPIDFDTGNFEFIAEGYSENWQISIDPFIFEFTWE